MGTIGLNFSNTAHNVLTEFAERFVSIYFSSSASDFVEHDSTTRQVTREERYHGHEFPPHPG